MVKISPCLSTDKTPQEVSPQVLKLRKDALTLHRVGSGVDVDILGVGEGLGGAVGVSVNAGLNCTALRLAPSVRLQAIIRIASHAKVKIFFFAM